MLEQALGAGLDQRAIANRKAVQAVDGIRHLFFDFVDKFVPLSSFCLPSSSCLLLAPARYHCVRVSPSLPA